MILSQSGVERLQHIMLGLQRAKINLHVVEVTTQVAVGALKVLDLRQKLAAVPARDVGRLELEGR